MQESDSIDLTVTSPPYDAIRDYENGNSVDLNLIGKELLRSTKNGGVAVVVIQDGTKNFAKSLTSFRMAVSWVDMGWKLFECCIYAKNGRPGKWWNQRFRVDHEYIMIFFKGDRPQFFNKEHMKVPCLEKYQNTTKIVTVRKTDGTLESQTFNIGETKCPGTILKYLTSSQESFNSNNLKRQHPASFPEKLTSDFIQCFSKPGDLVCDPFLGSGTTCVNALNLGRNFVGCDISDKYINIARQRIQSETSGHKDIQ